MGCQRTGGTVDERRSTLIRSFHIVLLAGGSARQGESLCPVLLAPECSKSAQITTAGHSPVREIVQLRVPNKQQLHGPKILRTAIDQRGLCPPERVCPVACTVQSQLADPGIYNPGVLPRRQMG